MKGAGIIAEGASAVIIYPAPQCSNNRDMTKYVARLSKTRRNLDLLSKSNIPLLKKLKQIDPTQKYFLYPEFCKFKLNEENKKDGFTNKNKNYAEIVLKGKEKWFDWRKKDWKEPTPKQLAHLKHAINLLHKNKIVHGDLSGDNIIFGNDDLPRIIDFSTSIMDAPQEFLEQEKHFIERGLPTLEYYKVYQSNTPEGRILNEERKKFRTFLKRTKRIHH